jgi:GAF domain-containing protein
LWAADLGHLDELDEAAFAASLDGVVSYANPVSVRLQPRLGEPHPPAVGLRDLVPEHLRDALDEVLGQVRDGTPWRGRLEVLAPDATPRQTDVVAAPLRHAGEIVGVLLLVDDPTEPDAPVRDTRRLEDRLTRLARVATELGTADDIGTVTDVVITHLCDAVGATVASLSLVDGDRLVLAGLRGGTEGAAERWTSFPLAEHTPAGDVARSGEPLFLVGRAAIDASYPDLEKAAEGERSMIALPLRLTGRTVGVVTLSFPGKRILDGAELEFFRILTDSCAQALERIRAQQEASLQEARSRFLADASAELATSLDYEATLTNVARMAIPRFADWSGVDLLEDDRIHRLAVEHFDPAKVQFALDIERRYPSDRNTGEGAWAAIATGESVLIPEIPDEMLVAAAKDEEHLRLARELQLRSALIVPLVARDRVLGAISWVMAESGRTYTEDDVKFAEELARRAAVAIDNAQLHSQTREVAQQLQRAVLPELPTSLPGWRLASLYEPAGRTEVGGDFYDVVPLSDGRVAGFVGDVMGRGVRAAAAMAQMRAALRAHIAADPEPEAVINRMDSLFDTYQMTQLVTLVYFVLSPDAVSFVNAGHLPLMVLGATGAATALTYADGPPLGAGPAVRRSHTAPLSPGDTLLAYTDGVVERRAEDIETGLKRMLGELPRLATGPLTSALAALVDEVRDHSRDDDLAALAVRREL